MSVHSTHYDDPEEYERDLKHEYAREQYEQDHGIEDDIPFYTDDPDDPHWKCENCAYFKELHIRKRIIKAYPKDCISGMVTKADSAFYSMQVVPSWNEFIPINICTLLNCECDDDGHCCDFEEIGDAENWIGL